jgi:hypothetical protein
MPGSSDEMDAVTEHPEELIPFDVTQNVELLARFTDLFL